MNVLQVYIIIHGPYTTENYIKNFIVYIIGSNISSTTKKEANFISASENTVIS